MPNDAAVPTSKLTITEALQEIKTINKRLTTKRQAVMGYVARDVRIKDPLEAWWLDTVYPTRTPVDW